MSLLDGDHVVEVTPAIEVQDQLGTTTLPGAPVVVSGVSIQFGSVAEPDEQGQVIGAIWGRGTWPGGYRATIKILKGPLEGEEFDQFGPPFVRAMSPSTAHFKVRMSSRGMQP